MKGRALLACGCLCSACAGGGQAAEGRRGEATARPRTLETTAFDVRDAGAPRSPPSVGALADAGEGAEDAMDRVAPGIDLFRHEDTFFLVAEVEGERLCFEARVEVRERAPLYAGLLWLRAPVRGARIQIGFRIPDERTVRFGTVWTPLRHVPPEGLPDSPWICRAETTVDGTIDHATLDGTPLYLDRAACEANRADAPPLPMVAPHPQGAVHSGEAWCFRGMIEFLIRRFWTDSGV